MSEKVYRAVSSPGDAILAALIFLGAAALLALGMTHDLGPYDEGLVLTGAMRVAHGALVHRDFYANYGPAQFYVLAALFKLFGPSVLVERLWDTVVRAAIVAVAFRLAARSASRVEGLAAAALCAIWLLAFGFPAFPVFPALLFALVALACLMPMLYGHDGYAPAVGAGVSLGVTTLFRYDVGAYAAIGLGLVIVARGLASPHRWRRVAGHLVCLGLGLALVCGPVALLYLRFDIAMSFVADIIDYPAKYYWRMRSLPFPGPRALMENALDTGVYLPPAVWLASACAALAWRGRLATAATTRAWMIGALTLLSALFYLKGLVRVSAIHMALSIVPALIALALWLPLGRALTRSRTLPGPIAVAMAVAFFGVTLPNLIATRADVSPLKEGMAWAFRASTWAPASAAISPELAPCHPQAGLGRMACFATSKDRADAVLYVEAHTKPTDLIFVGLDRHDRLFANDNVFYFLAGREPATKYSHFDPGLQTRADIQGFMIDELKARKPKLVVLDSGFSGFSEPNASNDSSGIVLLDRFLAATYRSVRSFGPYTILEPRAPG